MCVYTHTFKHTHSLCLCLSVSVSVSVSLSLTRARTHTHIRRAEGVHKVVIINDNICMYVYTHKKTQPTSSHVSIRQHQSAFCSVG